MYPRDPRPNRDPYGDEYRLYHDIQADSRNYRTLPPRQNSLLSPQYQAALMESLNDIPKNSVYNQPHYPRQHFDEDEMLQRALKESLVSNPHQPNTRLETEDEMLRKAMQESLKDAAIASRPPPERQIDPVSLSRSLEKLEQDDEYELAQAKAISERDHKNQIKRMEDELKAEEKQKESLEKEKLLDELLEKSKLLPEEPENGVMIAVTLPNNTRITRKFALDEIGDHIYTWVALDKQMLDQYKSVVKFELTHPFKDFLKKDESLEQQGIKGKTLLRVMIE